MWIFLSALRQLFRIVSVYLCMPEKKDIERLEIKIPKPLKDQLKKFCKENYVSLTSVVRRGIRREIQGDKK